jgi:hypothetical protein
MAPIITVVIIIIVTSFAQAKIREINGVVNPLKKLRKLLAIR